MRALERRRFDPLTVDGVVAVSLFAAAQLELWFGHAIGGPRAFAVAATFTGTLPVAVRRRRPLSAAALVMGTHGAIDLVDKPAESVALIVAWLCVLYAIAVWTDTRGFIVGIAVFGAIIVISLFGIDGSNIQASDVFAWLGVPLLSMVLARRAIRERELRVQALAVRNDLLERERDLVTREAVAVERATIARELHDVVAHKVSVMVIQAGAERTVLDPDAAASTEETLRTIEATGREALVELRRLLDVLRGEGSGRSLAPQPTLGDVDRLVNEVRDVGVNVELRIEGSPCRLAPGVELSAYRIVQEALTNVIKHAAESHTLVALRYGPHELAIEVRDDGRGGTVGPGTGHGLLGMRERAALHGGRVEAGPELGGGYAVRAWLPAGS